MKNIKRTFSFVLCLALLVPFALVLSACGHNHTWATEYSMDSEYHWKDCTDEKCNAVTEKANHTLENGICTTCNFGAVAKITSGQTTKMYTSLQQAIDDVPYVEGVPTQQTTITLVDPDGDNEIIGSGVQIGYVNQNKNICIDFNGITYIMNWGVGDGKTNGLWLLKGSKVHIKNGTLTHNTNKDAEHRVSLLIQNYTDLVVEDMTLIGKNPKSPGTVTHVLSCNHGNITVTGDTYIYADDKNDLDRGGVAFDSYYQFTSTYQDGVSVTFDENFTGYVKGILSMDVDPKYMTEQGFPQDWPNFIGIALKAGTFDITLNIHSSVTSLEGPSRLSVSGGTYNIDMTAHCIDGYKCTKISDNKYVVTAE